MLFSMIPSLVDDLLDSLDYLVDYPHGCVEQNGGWGWQGNGEAHEMMTPYAVHSH